MASSIGTTPVSGIGDSFYPDLSDASNIQTALKLLYYGTTGAATTNGIYGALNYLSTSPTFSGNVTVTGNLTVNGTTTTINSTTISVDDANIELGSVATPTNTTANGGGITLKGATDKTILWDSTNSNWTTSENWNLATGKTLKINNVDIASGTGAALVLGANASTSIAVGANGGTATILNPTVTLTNATTLNINGVSPTLASSSTGTLTLFNTNLTTVNAFGAATTIGLGNSGGTTTIAGNVTLSTAAKTLTLPNGGTSTAPLKFAGTTTVTSPNFVAGAVEYNGKNFLVTPTTTAGQGYLAAPYITANTTDKSITVGTSQPAFNTTTAGITLPVGWYEVEMQTTFSYTYGSAAADLVLGIAGTAVTTGYSFTQEHYTASGTFSNAATAFGTYIFSAVSTPTISGRHLAYSKTSTVAASLTANAITQTMGSIGTQSQWGTFKMKGLINVTTQGTMYPTYTLNGTGATGTLYAGGYCKVTPVGSSAFYGYWQ